MRYGCLMGCGRVTNSETSRRRGAVGATLVIIEDRVMLGVRVMVWILMVTK